MHPQWTFCVVIEAVWRFFDGLFGENRTYRRLRGGFWEKWCLEPPQQNTAWAKVDFFYKRPEMGRGTPIQEAYGYDGIDNFRCPNCECFLTYSHLVGLSDWVLHPESSGQVQTVSCAHCGNKSTWDLHGKPRLLQHDPTRQPPSDLDIRSHL